MKKQITRLMNWLIRLVKTVPGGWQVLTFVQLRYHFSALRAGVRLNKNDQVSLFNFRRNIHRIEKGLSYETSKSIFAKDYILETLRILKAAKKNTGFDSDTVKWGESVLQEFFRKVGDDPIINKGREEFAEIKLEFPEGGWFPYLNRDRVASSVTYEQLFQLAKRRRSVRYFKAKKVSEEIVQKALEVARLSPSACNRQSFGYLFYNDPAIAAKIAAVPGGVKGYNLQNVIIVYGTFRGYFDVRDINAPVIDASLANMSFLFALETMGLGTVCINWPNLPDRERKIRRLIDLSKDEFVVMMIGLGYPRDEGKIPYSGKRTVRALLQTNKRIKE